MSNYVKYRVIQCKKTTTTNITLFHGRYSFLSVLEIPFRLKILNYSNHHHSKSMVHIGYMNEAKILVAYFIVFIVHLYTMHINLGIDKGE